MGIGELEPRQLTATVWTMGVGSTVSPAPSPIITVSVTYHHRLRHQDLRLRHSDL
jgi:hypothetical protein